MSSQPLSRSVVQELAESAFGLLIGGVTSWAYFTAEGLHALGSLFTVGSLLLFGVIGVVTVALIALSISLPTRCATSCNSSGTELACQAQFHLRQ